MSDGSAAPVDRRETRLRRIRALTDAALVRAMRDRDPDAFAGFLDRFQPVLEAYVRRIGIPTADWGVCVHDVLVDAALRLTSDDAVPLPRHLASYLRGMARHAYARVRRSEGYESKYASLAGNEGGERVVHSLVSESTVRAAGGETSAELTATSQALNALAVVLRQSVDADDQVLLSWVANDVPYRTIAEWTGSSYDATAKRIARLTKRLRLLAAAKLDDFPPRARREIDRFLRRATGPGVLAPRRRNSGEENDHA